ncbi:MAG: hypothetical protein AAFY41_02105 [Bacteroidota bacterium]
MITAIIGPPLMTGIFTYYTNPENKIYFPGAPFILACALALFGSLFAYRSLRTLQKPERTEKTI